MIWMTPQQWPLLLGFLLLLLSLGGSQAWLPPRDKYGNLDPSWESVHAMRQRLGIAFNYTPTFMHPEACRHLTEAECQDADESLHEHAAAAKRRFRMVREQRQRLLEQPQQQPQQQEHDNATTAAAFRDLQELDHNPNIGNFKVLVLMIQFSDHDDRALIDKSVIEDLWNNDMKEWFAVNSHGMYTIEPVVIDWIKTDNTETYYSFDGQQGFRPELQQAMWPALDQLDNRPDWDWSQFDIDQDGKLDSVVMMHSAINALIAGPDCFGQEADYRIWPHAYASSAGSWESKDGSVRLNGYTVNSVYDGDCDEVPLTPGLTCHEFCHTWGLIDLYPMDLSTKGTGAWDVMSYPYGPDDSGRPGLMSTFSRMAAEWMTPTLITQDGDYTALPTFEGLHAYKIDITQPGRPFEEYLLIENRQATGFEENLWTSGLLIVHVDDFAEGQEFPGWYGQQGWPENGNHYKVAALQKDGNYDLEQDVNNGDEGDLFIPGDKLGPGMGGTVYPNTDSYQSGIIVETGITIEVLSQEGTTITFRVSGLQQGEQTTSEPPAETNPPTDMTQTDTDSESTTLAPSASVPGTTPAPSSSSGDVPTDFWVLSRPPTPTRAPFVPPEFPVQEPAGDILFGSDAVTSKNGIVCSLLMMVGAAVLSLW